MKPWTPEERAWAQECLDAGDTAADVAQAAGRDPDDVRRCEGLRLPHLTPTEREVLSLYVAGCSFPEIDAARGGRFARPGKAAASCICALRRRGHPVPHRRPETARAAAAAAAARQEARR